MDRVKAVFDKILEVLNIIKTFFENLFAGFAPEAEEDTTVA